MATPIDAGEQGSIYHQALSDHIAHLMGLPRFAQPKRTRRSRRRHRGKCKAEARRYWAFGNHHRDLSTHREDAWRYLRGTFHNAKLKPGYTAMGSIMAHGIDYGAIEARSIAHMGGVFRDFHASEFFGVRERSRSPERRYIMVHNPDHSLYSRVFKDDPDMGLPKPDAVLVLDGGDRMHVDFKMWEEAAPFDAEALTKLTGQMKKYMDGALLQATIGGSSESATREMFSSVQSNNLEPDDNE